MPASRVVSSSRSNPRLGFEGLDMKWVVEPGEFILRVSNSSVGGLQGTLEV
ncbi:MAG: hypothetical protein ACRD2X_08690 [Vicinamibacteraceae bacterium]